MTQQAPSPNQTVENIQIIPGLLFPVKDKTLLLPNVSVAEVVDYQTPIAEENAPHWYLGKISWRGLMLPVISFEAANGGSVSEKGENPRIAVINNIGTHHQDVAFFAFVTQNIPRLVKVESNNIEENTSDKTGVAEKINIAINDEVATIPDIEYLESLIHQHVQSRK
ncbi:MAG: chemotaxis protein CheW [Hahellaceae bacterium]|nr:chemotaxis protein CheW [Hahellaceae bacterium]MCP5210183.1 chemotaxis protein CheW [Hahellaceae bacterium]